MELYNLLNHTPVSGTIESPKEHVNTSFSNSNSLIESNSSYSNNHFIELLKRMYLSNINNIKKQPTNVNTQNNTKVNTKVSGNVWNMNNPSHKSILIKSRDQPINSQNNYVNLNPNSSKRHNQSQDPLSLKILMEYFKKEIENKTHLNIKSPLYSLVFNDTDDFLVVSTNEINENLRHIDPFLDRVLHQMKYMIFEKSASAPTSPVKSKLFTTVDNLWPICYLEKSIKESDLTYSKADNSYLRSYVYDVVSDYHTKEFDKQKISIYRHYIGSYITMFFCKDKWFFILHNNIHEFNCSTHPVLYEHIGSHITKFDKNMCYHLVIVDTRLRRLITPTTDTNYVVLIKLTEKYTLNVKQLTQNILTSRDIRLLSMSPDFGGTDLLHDVLILDKRIYLSCLDELHVRLEELDILNSKTKRLLNRGYVVQLNIDNFDVINIAYDTLTYKRLISMIPTGMSIHEVHLYLYQSDKLNYFLQHVTDTHIDIVKRINASMSTMSREILDIYHMTRKKKNSALYNILPQSYKLILYQLHSDYIVQKNKRDNKDNQDKLNLSTNSMDSEFDSSNIFFFADNECDDKSYKSLEGLCNSSELTKSKDDIIDGETEGKVSISVDNVYIKLKELEIYSLVDLYKDRDELIKTMVLEENAHLTKPIEGSLWPIKQCTNTKIQSKLLSMKIPI